MSHTIREKAKLLNRVRRIRGQIDAIERSLISEAGCSKMMHLLAASGGAINSLIAEVLEDHVREHLLEENGRKASRTEAADELIDVIHAYWK